MSDIEDLFGRRCGDYDPDCATCFVYKQQDEIEKLRDKLADEEYVSKDLEEMFQSMRGEADALRAENAKLLAEIEEVKRLYKYHVDLVSQGICDGNKLRAENEKLRALLEEARGWVDRGESGWQDFVDQIDAAIETP